MCTRCVRVLLDIIDWNVPVAEARADVALLVDAQTLALVQIRREIHLTHDPSAEPEARAGPDRAFLGLSGSAVDRILVGRYVTVAVSERAAVIVELAVELIVLVGWLRPRLRLVFGYVELVRNVIRVVAIRATVNAAVGSPFVILVMTVR